ncbi:CidA/LrgA family protein [Camelimonas fluminis]|uniref:CidA/LrgA family protein n=1 Tax=Camelimonas fluminis TaxID=1576911 RepID=A0ABV7UEP4_9HYPH|nr:CidA/LrgA family protein [Camelimonas fluminis]
MTGYLPGLLALLLCQLAGEAASRLLRLPLPGAVLGLLMMTAILLALRGRTPKSLVHASRSLIGVLSLLFVPAGVGVISLGKVVAGQTTAMVAALLASVVITLVATSWAFVATSRWQERRRMGQEHAGQEHPGQEHAGRERAGGGAP